ncbi:MAG: hypothetical protein JWM19_1352 [Actinomycetia bacterium]|nr:hypothetical protein [Actinomycetes bacterium]
MVTARAGHVVAPGSVSFDLHTLGWRAFQDLCAAVIRTVWRQSAKAFADSNDGGRDGAFYGTWHGTPDGAGAQDLPAGPFVLQCKHTKKPGATLSASDLEEEFEKVPALVKDGLCRGYALMTNADVTGRAEEKIRDRLLAAGVEHPLVLDGRWVCDTIAMNQKLRMFVPRVYGLGDLSKILDDRAYEQASVLLEAARDQIAAFVMTEPYRRAVQALEDNGFVLLIGDPAAGKSASAMMLALAAADKWGCLTVKPRTASELVTHWDTNEPAQFFWVDDAFGTVRHEEHLTQDWARSMPHVGAAIAKGARVVLTSRGYIYEEARPLLKGNAYAWLRERPVTVDVEELTRDERTQILYNQITAGNQPAEVKTAMKPSLDYAAARPFRPEMARRLGLRAFTGRLTLTAPGIEEFITRPRQFLHEVYEQLGPHQQAALALAYAAAPDGSLASPLALDDAQRDIIDRAGSTPGEATRALKALTGSFLQVTRPPLGQPGWAFRHPTLWEGFASWVATQPHLLTVVLSGLTDDALLGQADCEDEDAEEKDGTLLRVPPPLYRPLAERVARILRECSTGSPLSRAAMSVTYGSFQELYGREAAALRFLSGRSSDSFLRAYLEVDPGLPGRMLNFTSFLDSVTEPDVLARLREAGLLSEHDRLQAVHRMAALAIETPDSGWLAGYAWKVLLEPHERAALLRRVREDLAPGLGDNVCYLSDGRQPGYDPIEQSLSDYEEAFEKDGDHETAALFAAAARKYAAQPVVIDGDDGWDILPESRREIGDARLGPPVDTGRSIFDDIDQ